MCAQCHPFAHGRYLFMHNGIIAGFAKIRRKLLTYLSDEAYDSVHSFHSDSAVSFALFLSQLPNMADAFPAEVLMRAVQSTYELIAQLQEEAGVVADCSLLNFVMTDGQTLIATRYVSPSSAEPASLYYAEGSTFRCACSCACSALSVASGTPIVTISAPWAPEHARTSSTPMAARWRRCKHKHRGFSIQLRLQNLPLRCHPATHVQARRRQRRARRGRVQPRVRGQERALRHGHIRADHGAALRLGQRAPQPRADRDARCERLHERAAHTGVRRPAGASAGRRADVP